MSTIILNDNHLGALLHFRKEVIDSLITFGHRIILVAPFTDEQVHLPGGGKYLPIIMNRTSKGLYDLIHYAYQLNKIIRDIKPDIIINYTIKPILIGSLVSKIRKVPSVAFFAGVSTVVSSLVQHKGLLQVSALKVFKRILNYNQKAVFLNNEDMSLMKQYGLLAIDKMTLLDGGEGVNIDKYSPRPKKSNDTFKAVMVGRVLKSKGYHEFVNAANLCKQRGLKIDFFLVGGIDDIHPDRISLAEIESDVQKGIFSYTGHINNIPDFIGDADCVILPSYYNEGMNRSLMEALSMGIPIITTDNRGCRELVLNGETGFLIPPKDYYALYDAIKKLYDMNESKRNSFRIKSREYAVRRFDVRKVVDSYNLLISNILKN